MSNLIVKSAEQTNIDIKDKQFTIYEIKIIKDINDNDVEIPTPIGNYSIRQIEQQINYHQIEIDKYNNILQQINNNL